MEKPKDSPTRAPSSKRIVYSTTDGRQKFPDILQVTYGDKAVIGFDRYGRTLGALVPMEAVRMLARRDDVDADVRGRIERAALALLSELADDEDDLVDLPSVDEARRQDLPPEDGQTEPPPRAQRRA